MGKGETMNFLLRLTAGGLFFADGEFFPWPVEDPGFVPLKRGSYANGDEAPSARADVAQIFYHGAAIAQSADWQNDLGANRHFTGRSSFF
jgi:hypothetical protein